MPLIAYNLTASPVTLAAGNPARVLPPSAAPPVRGTGTDVTSELRGLSEEDYDLIQAQVTAGDINFEWIGKEEYPMAGTGGDIPAPTPWEEGGGGSGGGNVFVFAPEHPSPSGNVYTTWEAAHAARMLLPGPATIEVDCTYGSADIPAQAGGIPWDMSNTILRGRLELDGGSPGVDVEGQFEGLVRIEDIDLDGQSGIQSATGTIICVAQAEVPNGSSMTISDGIGQTNTYWFDVSGAFIPPGGYDSANVRVDLSAAVSDEDVKIAFIAAIEGSDLQVWCNDPGEGNPVFCIVNRRRGSQGNVPITTAGGSTILAEGMLYGEGGPMIVTEPDSYNYLYMRNATYEEESDGGMFLLVRSWLDLYMYDESELQNDDGPPIYTADDSSGINATLYNGSEIESGTLDGFGYAYVDIDATSDFDPDDQNIEESYVDFETQGRRIYYYPEDTNYWKEPWPADMREAADRIAARTERRVVVFPGALLPAGDGFTMHAQAPGGAPLNLTTGWSNLMPFRGLKITRSDAGPATVDYSIGMVFTDGEEGGFNLTVPRNGSAETHLAGKVVGVSTNVDPVSTSDFVAGNAFSVGFGCVEIYRVSCDGILDLSHAKVEGREATVTPSTAPDGVHCYAVEALAAGGKS